MIETEPKGKKIIHIEEDYFNILAQQLCEDWQVLKYMRKACISKQVGYSGNY